MNKLNRYLILDVCATAIALLALTGTVAALSVSPSARAQSDGKPAPGLSLVAQRFPSAASPVYGPVSK